VVFATRFGLVTLIADGYRFVAWVFIAIYLVPLLSYGIWRVTLGTKAAPPVPIRAATEL
jgi:uncharacterized membrane protein YkvI